MSELIKKILEFFGSKAVSMPKKMLILIVFCLGVLFVDNLCGFSYYFVQSYKLDYITSLEDARFKYAKDKVVSQELDRMLVNALNRWTVYDVTDIFQKTSLTTSEAREQKLVEEIVEKKNIKEEVVLKDVDNSFLSKVFPIEDRSPFWHTICSSLLLVFLLLVCIIYVICSPFIKDKSKNSALKGMGIVIPVLLVAILFTQWLFSFIPDIDGRPIINNIIYVCLNGIATYLLIKSSSKSS